ncbi:MAG: hypothetical protein PHP97_01285 [Candidatus Shapirobacteria bacterium]|nr:hypothetical protein [Candidatus Shapirobacteria bacterium]MDD4383230.1 hypothetical protein [Candidatus Shapirobacteria bacterium]
MKHLRFLIPLALISLFIFLRFYNIKDSLFFFNDVGRDLLVLQNWQLSGKPPLLGPQTSVIPFNQSSIYFYYLYIFYIITNGSVFSALFANAFLYIAMYIFGLIVFKKDKKITTILNISFFLISIHPQYIAQSRFVWNPSLVTPFIMSSFFSFYLLTQKYSKIRLWIFSLSIAAAISLSYSVIPLFIAIFIYWLIFYQKYFFKIFFSIFTSFLFLNITTVFFELRHNFLLTKSLLFKSASPQSGISINEKFNDIAKFVIDLPSQNINQYVLLIFVFLSIILITRQFKNKNITLFTSFIFLLTFLTYFILPVSAQAHYVFPIICLLFILITSQPIIRSIIIVFLLSLLYLTPANLNSYFQKAPRTYSQMEQCFKEYCQKNPEPINVSVSSSYHPYHNGPEHRYLLKKSGCNVQVLEDGQKAKTMALVLDNNTFDPEKSNFYELSLFGPYQTRDTFNCLPNFQILNLINK